MVYRSFDYITIVRSAYITGIEITHRVWEIIAIDAPVFVSPPYAAGNTTVFKPRGVAYANSASVRTSSDAPISLSITSRIAGIINNLNAVAM